jgi:hypothetical protein
MRQLNEIEVATVSGGSCPGEDFFKGTMYNRHFIWFSVSYDETPGGGCVKYTSGWDGTSAHTTATEQ